VAHVVIFGGGVAGLTAAQELVERGFTVTVFEARHWGGKIRSMGKPGTGTGGREDLPGEHGFHFFPSFYRHLPDTMQRIPLPGGGTVFDNLVHGSRELIAPQGAPPAELTSHLPRTLSEWFLLIKALGDAYADITRAELMFFAERMLMFMTACDERRIAEYDGVTWWEFVGADCMSYGYQQLVARLPPLLLIAVHPTEASARTMGNSFISMSYAGTAPGNNIERSLNGPPSDTWLDPWLAYLGDRVRLVMGGALEALDFDPGSGRITGAEVSIEGKRTRITADYYVCALPVEVMAPLVTEPMRKHAPSLAGLDRLRVAWMSGIQYFLDRPFPLVNGHVAYEDSAWALTSVSQAQFWTGVELEDYGQGDLREVFSVIISDWDTPGTEVVHKPARACTAEEIFEESLAQIQAALKHSGLPPLRREYVLDWMLDPDIAFPCAPFLPVETAEEKGRREQPRLHRSRLIPAREFARMQRKRRAAAGTGTPALSRNAEPLFISTVGAWSDRPEAVTEIGNLFLASDYVKTTVDIASAEGANQAARKAVNGILDAAGSSAPRVRVWNRVEPLVLAPWQAVDRYRFQRGLPQLALPRWLRRLILPGRGDRR
jgi:15-cis-phytoene desaturase